MVYQVKLEQFEGPFDLLLFFIERDELDIYDIPIAKITDDYLAYIKQLERLNIDVASEFILVAATLMRIKARMLIPRRAVDEEGNEIDPRDELIERLVEYKKYKATLESLREMEREQQMKIARGNVKRETETIAMSALEDVELEELSLFGLLKAFQRVLENYDREKNRKIHTVMRHNYTVQEESAYILGRVKVGSRTSFEDVFLHCRDKIHAIITFLALLTLLNDQKIRIYSNEGVNSFSLYRRSEEEE